MLKRIMTNVINTPDKITWEALARLKLGDAVHPKRVQGYILSREALRTAFREKNVFLTPQEMEFDHHDQIVGLPDFTFSISHTQEWGAAVLGERKNFLSVGIDIEPVARTVKEAIVERISHPMDISLDPLPLWCLKEAAFKAVMNTRRFQHPVEFSSLQIGNETWQHASGLSGQWTLETLEGHCLAMAWIPVTVKRS